MTTPEAIPNEAVEAAARAIFEVADPFSVEECATAALTAAAPHIQAAALRDAAEVVQEECYVRSGDCFCGSAQWLTARADQLESSAS